MSSDLAASSPCALILVDDRLPLTRRWGHWIDAALRQTGRRALQRDVSQIYFIADLLANEEAKILDVGKFVTVQSLTQLAFFAWVDWIVCFNNSWDFEKNTFRELPCIRKIINLCTHCPPVTPSGKTYENNAIHHIVFSSALSLPPTERSDQFLHRLHPATPLEMKELHAPSMPRFALLSDALPSDHPLIPTLQKLLEAKVLDIFGTGWEKISLYASPPPPMFQLSEFYSTYAGHLHLQNDFMDIPDTAIHAAACKRPALILGTREVENCPIPIIHPDNAQEVLAFIKKCLCNENTQLVESTHHWIEQHHRWHHRIDEITREVST